RHVKMTWEDQRDRAADEPAAPSAQDCAERATDHIAGVGNDSAVGKVAGKRKAEQRERTDDPRVDAAANPQLSLFSQHEGEQRVYCLRAELTKALFRVETFPEKPAHKSENESASLL